MAGIASAGVATSVSYPIPPDYRTPEQKEADARRREIDSARWLAEEERERRELTETMLQESAPLLKLIGEKVTGVLREREKDPEYEHLAEEYAPLVVRVTTESGLVLRLEGTSHGYDGEMASIRAEAISE